MPTITTPAAEHYKRVDAQTVTVENSVGEEVVDHEASALANLKQVGVDVFEGVSMPVTRDLYSGNPAIGWEKAALLTIPAMAADAGLLVATPFRVAKDLLDFFEHASERRHEVIGPAKRAARGE